MITIIEFVIAGYIISGAAWVFMGSVNAYNGVKNSFSGILMGIIWFWNAYRNYEFYFIDINQLSINTIWKNGISVAGLVVATSYMAYNYIPVFKEIIKKHNP